MNSIRYFKLKNEGGFVARMKIIYGGNEKEKDEHGNIVYFTKGTYEPSGYHDICASGERTIDLKDTKIQEGAAVKLHVVVVFGDDKEATEEFIYHADCPEMAVYKISGVVRSNRLVIVK